MRAMILLAAAMLLVSCLPGGDPPEVVTTVPQTSSTAETDGEPEPRPSRGSGGGPGRDCPPEDLGVFRYEGRRKIPVELWYGLTGAGMGADLVAVRRYIPTTRAIAAATLREWVEGPNCSESRAGIVGGVPEETELLGVSISEGTAVIDLSRDFEWTGMGTYGEGILLEQLAWTITQFPTVERALLKIDGSFKESYLGHGFIIDKAHPLTRS